MHIKPYSEPLIDPDAVGELQRLVQHVLPLHVPLGDGEDVVALQLPGDGVCKTGPRVTQRTDTPGSLQVADVQTGDRNRFRRVSTTTNADQVIYS